MSEGGGTESCADGGDLVGKRVARGALQGQLTPAELWVSLWKDHSVRLFLLGYHKKHELTKEGAGLPANGKRKQELLTPGAVTEETGGFWTLHCVSDVGRGVKLQGSLLSWKCPD